MLFLREYKPNNDSIIYHYCDANAFHSICSNRKLWFNDLYSMNDSSELHWGYSIWEQAATKKLKKYDREFIDRIDEIIHKSGLQGLLLSSSFSKDKDVLSQWRAYADNGLGYVIGFSATDLLSLPVRALEVLYDKEQQIKEAEVTIDILHEIEKDNQENFRTYSYLFGTDFAAFKNPGFSEEREIRLIHSLAFEKSNSFVKLIDEGGIYFGEERSGEGIKFRIKDHIPTPYIELDFANGNKINPIKEVIIGPKNDVKLSAICIYLETIGIGDVNIENSKVPFR